MCVLTITHSKRSAVDPFRGMADAVSMTGATGPGDPDAAAAAANAVDSECLQALVSSVSGNFDDKPNWSAVFSAAGCDGICLAFKKMPMVRPSKAVLRKDDYLKALDVLKVEVGGREKAPDEVWALLTSPSAIMSFTALIKGMRTSFETTSAKCSRAAVGTVSGDRTRPPPSADKFKGDQPTFPEATVAAMLGPHSAVPLGFASQISDWNTQTGVPMATRPPIIMFNLLMQTLMCTPPSLPTLAEAAPDLYQAKSARWQILRIFLENVVPALALCCVSIMGFGILVHFPAGHASDEITAYG